MTDENTETAPVEEPAEKPNEEAAVDDVAQDEAAQQDDNKEKGQEGSSMFNGSLSYYFSVGKKFGKASFDFIFKKLPKKIKNGAKRVANGAKKIKNAFMEGYRAKEGKETAAAQPQPVESVITPQTQESKTPEQKDPLADLSPEKRTKIDKELAQLREFHQMDISQDMKDSFTRMFENELSATGKDGFGLNEEQVKAIKEQNSDLFPKKEQANKTNGQEAAPTDTGAPQDNSLKNEDKKSKLDEAKKEGEKPKTAEPLHEQLASEHQADSVNDNKIKDEKAKEAATPQADAEASKTEETRASEAEVKTTPEPVKKDPLAELNPETRAKLDKEIATLREFKEKSGNPKLYGEFSGMLEKSMAEKGKEGFGLSPEQIQAVKDQNPGLFPGGPSKKKDEQTKDKKAENSKEKDTKAKEYDGSRKKDRGGRKSGKEDKPKGRPTSAKERRAAKRMAQLSGRVPPVQKSAVKPQQMNSNVMTSVLSNARQKD